MSILLVRVPEELGQVLSRRLIDQGDEVRALVTDDGPAPDLPGVHLATGRYLDDADLIERAAQNVRTIVVGEELPRPRAEYVAALVQGARAAGVSRIVYCDTEPDEDVVAPLRAAEIEYVVLRGGRTGLLRRGTAVGADDLAEAIDAADDTAGPLRLELDLTQPEAWGELKLESP